MGETEILRLLDEAARQGTIIRLVDSMILKIDERLRETPGELFGWEVIPMSAFALPLPEAIGSAWVFVIRTGLPADKHRHPNSVQYTSSYRGSGDLQTWSGASWKSNLLSSNLNLPPELRWLQIPAGMWHRPIVKSEWVVLSFHSATEGDLIEEAGEDGQEHTRKYSAR